MKIAAKEFHSQTGGVMETQAFKVEMNAMLFSTTIDGIYSDKIAAVQRELTNNARDSHIMAGRADKPFDVHLPGFFETEYWVRDYGVSLTHEEVMGLYTTMFASTKRDSNDVVGAIGLGSKSPFAYTSGFTVTCWKDGEERVYSCYLAETGEPQVSLLGRKISTEPEGVKITIPVNSNDIGGFRVAARKVHFAFDVKPNVVNENWEEKVPLVLYQGKNWTVYDDDENYPLKSGLFARQGCVLYPISDTFRKAHLPNVDSYLKMVVDFPIGDLSVATSREELGYNTQTTENLKKGFSQAISELSSQVSKALDGQTSYWDAALSWNSFANSGYGTSKRSVVHLVSNQVTYKGYAIRTKFPLELDAKAGGGMFFNSEDARIGKNLYTLTFRRPAHDTTLAIRQMEATKVYVEYPDCSFGPSRMRRVLSEADPSLRENILWLRLEGVFETLNWQERHGGIKVVDLSTIEPLKLNRGGSGKKDCIRLRCLVATDSVSHRDVTRAEFDLVPLTSDLLFIEQTGSAFSLFGSRAKSLSVIELLSYLRPLVKAGILEEGAKIYCANQQVMSRLETHYKKGVPFLKDEIDRRITKKYKTDTLKIPKSSHYLSKNNEFAENLKKTGVPLWGTFQNFVDTYGIDKSLAHAGLSKVELSVLQQWKPEIFIGTHDSFYEMDMSKLYDEFPLLRPIINGTYQSTRIDCLAEYLNLLKLKG